MFRIIRMKKIVCMIGLLIFPLLLASCTNNNEAQTKLETNKSSIFKVADVQYCEITADNVEVKSGIGNNNRTITVLKKGDRVSVLSEIRNWYVVRLDNNKLGAINSTYAKPVISGNTGTGVGSNTGNNNEQPQNPVQEPQPEPEQPQQPANNGRSEISPVKNASSIEKQMIQLVNKERRKNDLSPLKTDLQLTKVARIKAQDMVDNNYFSHYSPTYGSPFDMMNKFGIEYLSAAENLAGNSTVGKAHDSLMKSSGHRQNILNPGFTNIGIGVKPSKKYGYIFVQMFIKK